MMELEPLDPKLLSQLSQEVFARYNLAASPSWLIDYLKTVRNPPPPLPALASTANFRLLNSDFTQSLSRSTTTSSGSLSAVLLPHDITDVNIKYSQLSTSVPVQVLDILDVGSSKWSQIEAIERIERGEEVRGREIIRNLPIMSEEDGSGSSSGMGGQNLSSGGPGKKSAGPHRVLLQDAGGRKVWAFEVSGVPKMFITATIEDGGLQIGAKILLKKGCVVRRGLVMLEAGSVTVLGGKVEEWDQKWRSSRKQRLMDDLTAESE